LEDIDTMSAVSTFGATGTATIDALLGGVKWATTSLTYSFPTSASSYGTTYGDGEPLNNFGALNATQQAAARASLTMYAAVANLTFTEVTESASVQGEFRYAASDDPSTAWAYFPDPAGEGGDAWFNKSRGSYSNPVTGNYAYQTFMHETGHALGLKHPHEAEGAFVAMPVDQDSLAYTVMSYRSYIGLPLTAYVNGPWDFPQTLMMHDIRAIQQLYGANFTTNAGDTVYRWNPGTGQMTIDGVGQAVPGGNRIFSTVWDGGGTDTYDFSNYATNLSVNLSPGAWTTMSTAQLARLHYSGSQMAPGNIANALLYNGDLRSLIENAMGGSGNDAITGNQVANLLSGRGGADALYGLGGDDRLFGDGGNDQLCGDGGDDWLAGGPGADALNGGMGTDFARYDDGAYGNITVNLATPNQNTGVAAGDTYASVEGLAGGTGHDSLFGDSSANILFGLKGNDKLYGQAGDDVLFGDEGSDLLGGGSGLDILTGGAGKDVFIFRAGYEQDRISDFQGGTGVCDQIDLRGLFTTFQQALAASEQVGTDLVITANAATVLTIEDFYRGNFASDDLLL
jgi:serralysin